MVRSLVSEKRVAVVGGSNIDVCSKPSRRIIIGDSNIGAVEFAVGGVGRNIAEDLSLFGAEVSLLTAIGDDSFGRVVEDNASEHDITLLSEPFENEKTGVYSYITQADGTFFVGINDMAITEKLTPAVIRDNINALFFSDYVIFEANLRQDTIDEICEHDFKLVADGVSGMKCRKLINVLDKIYLLKLNLTQFSALSGYASQEDGIRKLVSMGTKRGIITLGNEGAMCFEAKADGIHAYYCSNMPGQEIVDATGCGEAFLAGFMMGLMRGHDMKHCLVMGQSAACLNADSISSVNRDMTYSALKETYIEFEKKGVMREVLING